MIKAYFPPIEEVPDSAFKITPEIEKKLESYKIADGVLIDAVEHGKQFQNTNAWKHPEKFETSGRQNSLYTGDNVNHPKHYTEHPSGVECIQVTEHMTFNCGNAVKYIWRNGLKDGNSSIQDLNKSIWYLQREIERLSKK